MKKSKKFTALLMTLIMVIACIPTMAITASAASIRLNKTAITLNIGDTYTQKLIGTNKKAVKGTSIKWKSSNTKAVKIDKNGKVTAVINGKSNCTATYKNKTYKFTVTVREPKLNSTSKTLYYGDSYTLKVTNFKKTIKWTTSNKNIATVSSKGVVKAVALGSATITATCGAKKLNCKIKIADRDASAKVTFKTSDGGYFIAGQSTAKVTFSIPGSACSKVTASIVKADDTAVYKKTFNKVQKGKSYSFTWDGKDSKDKTVSAGSYRVKITAGKKNTYSSYLAFKTKSDFAAGNGSKNKPFQIASVNQFKQIVKYSNAYFKQINNLDFDYTAVGNFFSSDKPFNGVYDGNGKTISKISATYPIFNTVGEKGQIKKLKLDKCSVVALGCALIVKVNYGKIIDCNINGSVSGSQEDESVYAGLVVVTNNGTISNCNVTGSSSGNTMDRYGYPTAVTIVGGIASVNGKSGKIINCNSTTVLNAISYNYLCCGGIVGQNLGLLTDCSSSTTISSRNVYNERGNIGTIAGYNAGQVIDCLDSNNQELGIIGSNEGSIL